MQEQQDLRIAGGNKEIERSRRRNWYCGLPSCKNSKEPDEMGWTHGPNEAVCNHIKLNYLAA